MAIFGSKKGETKVSAPKAKGVSAIDTSVIRRPRLTEKAANLSSANVYTFEVAHGASKHDVARAVVTLYKVTPVKVNVVNTMGKKVSLRTRRGQGTKNHMRKAYVFLKKGDTIDFAA